MLDQLRIGDKYSYDDFGASVAERKIGKPKKKTIKETVPHSNITYDFSKINGEIYWEERELQYILELDAETPEELEILKIDLSNWLMNVFEEDLFDPFIEDYHFKATYDDMDFDDSEVEKTTATVKFKAYPYMISNEPTRHIITIGDVGVTVNEDGKMGINDIKSLLSAGHHKLHLANPLILSLADSNGNPISITLNGVIFIERNDPPRICIYNEGKKYLWTIANNTISEEENEILINNASATMTVSDLFKYWGYYSLTHRIHISQPNFTGNIEGEIFVDRYSPTSDYVTIYTHSKKFVCSISTGSVSKVIDITDTDFSNIKIFKRSGHFAGHYVSPTIKTTTPVTFIKGDVQVDMSRYGEITSEKIILEPGDNYISIIPTLVPGGFRYFYIPGQIIISYDAEVL